jgi:hypothetical protein
VMFQRDYAAQAAGMRRRKYTKAQKAGTALGCISDNHDMAQSWRGARWQWHLI